jgi:DNA-binding response OmpR family regulator
MDKIFIIDDSQSYRNLLRAWLGSEYEVAEFATTEGAFEEILAQAPACILLDARLPKEDGFLFLHRLSRDMESMPAVIFMSGFIDEALRRNALALGAAECIGKGELDKQKLAAMIHRLLARKAA